MFIFLVQEHVALFFFLEKIIICSMRCMICWNNVIINFYKINNFFELKIFLEYPI